MSDKQPSIGLEAAQYLLGLQMSWIASADSKVPAVFAIDAAMLGVLAALIPPVAQWTIAGGIFTSLATLPLLASIGCLAAASFPRLSGPKGSLVFFGGIVNYSESEFIGKVASGYNDQFVEDLARQAYRNAEIASAKFAYVKNALCLMFASVPFWLLSLWLLYSPTQL